MGMGGIGLLEILLIGGGIYFLMRMLGRGRAESPHHSGRPAYAPGDPYGVEGHESPAESRASGPVYTGPDIEDLPLAPDEKDALIAALTS